MEWSIDPAENDCFPPDGYSVRQGEVIRASGLESKVCARMVMIELIRLETAKINAGWAAQ